MGEEGEARGRLVPAAGADEGLGGGQQVDRALQVMLVEVTRQVTLPFPHTKYRIELDFETSVPVWFWAQSTNGCFLAYRYIRS